MTTRGRVLSAAGVVLLALSFGLASSAQVLSGSWTTVVTVDPSPVTLGIDSEAVVTYSVGTWSFASDTVLDETGWTGQSFAATGTLGLVTLSTRAAFAPANPAAFFSRWSTAATVTGTGVTTIATFTLSPGNVELVMNVSGTLGLLDLRGVVTLGDVTPAGACDFGWQGVDLTMGFPFCCADVEANLSMGCDGFEELTFEVEGLGIAALPWVTVDFLWTFLPDEKSLVATPQLDFGAEICFDVYIGIGDGFLFPDLTVDGLGLVCAFGGVAFTGQSYWGTGSKPSLLLGTTYWEAYQIRTTDDSCCGPFGFDVTVFFDHGDELFDVGEIAAELSVDIGESLTFETGFSIVPSAVPAFAEWTLTFVVTW